MLRPLDLAALTLVALATPLTAGGGGSCCDSADAAASATATVDEPAPEVAAVEAEPPLVVHEWGTFTSLAGADGVQLEWRPLAGPSDLPSFVYGTPGNEADGRRFGEVCPGCHEVGCGCGERCIVDTDGRCRSCKGCALGSVRMETPVIYFYTPVERSVEVAVSFPAGRITEWYPAAAWVDDGIDWGRILLRPGATEPFPLEAGESHYYPARATAAVPLRVCNRKERTYEHERFLFYRGVGTFEQPLSARLDGDRIVLANRDAAPVARAIVFEREGEHVSFSVVRGLAPGAERALSRSTGGRSLASLEDVLAEVLVGQGLYDDEALAMIATWRDHWFEDGLRVFYVLPRATTDALLPLEVSPAPDELVRVLVGRIELLTPRMTDAVLGAAERVVSADPAVRTAAERTLARYGRFAEPLLAELFEDSRHPARTERLRELFAR